MRKLTCEDIGTNAGHGRVWQRPDGAVAKCMGVPNCEGCRVERNLMTLCQTRAVPSGLDLEKLRNAPYPSILEGTVVLHVATPAGLHRDTQEMLRGFFEEMCEKARRAELKYGYMNGWRDTSWKHEFNRSILEHFEKGDPRDVAIFCAIGFSHGWPTYDPKGEIKISISYDFKRTPDAQS